MGKQKIWTKDFTLLLSSNMFFSIALYMLLPIIPLYIVSLGGTDTDVGLVASAFSIASIAVRFSINLFFSKTQKKKLLLMGITMTTLATVLYFLFRGIGFVCFARIVQGLGFGIVSTLGTAIVADILPGSRRGEGIGYYLMGTCTMMAVSPAFGLFLVNNYGYDPMFLAAAAGPGLAFFICMFLTPAPRSEEPVPADSEKIPLHQRFFDRRLLLHTVLLFFMGVGRSADTNFISLFAQEQGLVHLSWYFVIQTAATFLMRGAIGKLTDKKGLAWSILPGGFASLSFLSILSVTHSTGPLLLAGLLSGISLGTLIPSMQAWMFSCVGSEKSNLASAMFFIFYDIGMGIGAIILGSLAGTVGYSLMFRIAAVCPALFLAIYLFRGRAAKTKAGA